LAGFLNFRKFSSHDNWRALENNYQSLKELLTKKYGYVDKANGAIVEQTALDDL
jgi:hypothetical protein